MAWCTSWYHSWNDENYCRLFTRIIRIILPFLQCYDAHYYAMHAIAWCAPFYAVLYTWMYYTHPHIFGIVLLHHFVCCCINIQPIEPPIHVIAASRIQSCNFTSFNVNQLSSSHQQQQHNHNVINSFRSSPSYYSSSGLNPSVNLSKARATGCVRVGTGVGIVLYILYSNNTLYIYIA